MQNKFEVLRSAVRQYNASAADKMLAFEESQLTETHPNTSSSAIVQISTTPSSKPKDASKATSPASFSYMDDFYEKVAIVKRVFNEIDQNTNYMRTLKNKSMQTAEEDTDKDIRHDLNVAIDTTNTLITKAKKALDTINSDTELLVQSTGETSEIRIRRNATLGLKRKFREILSAYQSIQAEFNSQAKVKLKRQIKYVYPEVTGEEMNEMLEEGAMSSGQALRSKMALSHQSLNNAVADISDKYRDIRHIERSMVELNQLFVDLATLVEFQGEQLDQIEYSVLKAKDYTASADTQLTKARKNQRAASKIATIGVAILAVLVAIILLIIFS